MGTIREIVASNDKELMPPPQQPVNQKGVIASPGLGLKDTIQVGDIVQHINPNYMYYSIQNTTNSEYRAHVKICFHYTMGRVTCCLNIIL